MWSVVALVALACVGLGCGVLLSRFLVGIGPEERTARRGRPDTGSSKDRDDLLAQKGPPIVLPPDPLRAPAEATPPA